jgi:hypothetical protein
MQVGFSAGAAFGQRTDVSAVSPDQFALLQSVSVDFDFSLKELYGEYQFPPVIARGQAKVSGKISFARIFGAIYADLFFGETAAIGAGLVAIENEFGTIPGSSTYIVTVANSATWTEDLGVYYAATGKRLAQVASGPTAGQYSVAAGVYTFAAADASLGVNISYLYNAASGQVKFTINNHLMGVTPTWKGVFYNPGVVMGAANGRTLVLNRCVSSKLSIPDKIDDFQMNEMDFSAFADDSGVIGTWTSVE